MKEPFRTTHVAVAYHVDDSRYANVGRGHARRSQRVYWENIAVMYASAARVFEDAHVFTTFTNAQPDETVSSILDRAGVQIESIPFDHKPPSGYHSYYGGSFYLLDVMRFYAAHLGPDESLLLVDPDCVWLRSPRLLLDRLAERRVLNYALAYEPAHRVHNTSREELHQIFRALAPDADDGTPPVFFGGEFHGFTRDTLKEAVQLIEEAWHDSLARHQAGLPKLTTDEPMLSYVYWHMGFRAGTANDLLRRVWTSPLLRNISEDPVNDELELLLWHLPAEKERGLRQLFQDCLQEDSSFWSDEGDEFRLHVAHRVGIWPSWARRATDAWKKRAIKLKHLVRPM